MNQILSKKQRKEVYLQLATQIQEVVNKRETYAEFICCLIAQTIKDANEENFSTFNLSPYFPELFLFNYDLDSWQKNLGAWIDRSCEKYEDENGERRTHNSERNQLRVDVLLLCYEML